MNRIRISGVGKTSLVRRYTENKWNPAGTASTTGAFFVTHKTDFKGTRVKLQIWDTAGEFCILACTRIAASPTVHIHGPAFLTSLSRISARPR
jgi:Ras family